MSEIIIVSHDNRMFLRKSECQITKIVKVLQDLGSDIKDQDINLTMLVFTFESMMMPPMNSHMYLD